jgi:hypothetical protein
MRYISLTLATVLLFTQSNGAGAAVIDFETTPAGITPTDDGVLAFVTPYTIGSVQVAFGFDYDTNGVVDADGEFELAGTFPGEGSNAGFSGSSGTDTADPGFGAQLGNWFLRSPIGGSDFGHFIIKYVSSSGPVIAASGEIWDIDGSNGATEEYTVRAYDAASNLLATQISPLGTQPTPIAPLDGQPWQFSFSGLTVGIDTIVIDFTGTKPAGIGLAFNNFYPTSVPEPASVMMLALGKLLVVGGRRRRRG